MLVTTDGQQGTIGGGALEFRAAEQARAMLDRAPGDWRVQDYPLGPLLGQCCGGRVRLLVERIDPAALGWLHDAEAGRMLETRLADDLVVRRIFERETATRPSARGPRPGVGTRFVEAVAERPAPSICSARAMSGKPSRAMPLACRCNWPGSIPGRTWPGSTVSR
jgi:xanthine dehydrogenase accessory factor